MVGSFDRTHDREHWIDVREGDELGTIELIPRADLELPVEGIQAQSQSGL